MKKIKVIDFAFNANANSGVAQVSYRGEVHASGYRGEVPESGYRATDVPANGFAPEFNCWNEDKPNVVKLNLYKIEVKSKKTGIPIENCEITILTAALLTGRYKEYYFTNSEGIVEFSTTSVSGDTLYVNGHEIASGQISGVYFVKI